MIGVQVNADEVVAMFRAISRQFPFATSKALNRLVLQAQKRQRYHQTRVFEIRQPTYWNQAVKIPKGGFATSKRLVARMIVDPKGRPDPTPKLDIWRRQEGGGTRKPVAGRKKLAIPGDNVPRTGRGIVRRTHRPKRLRRTFVVPFSGGGAGLFRRIGSRQKAHTAVAPGQRFGLRNDPNVEFMYYLADSARIEAVYEWYANAQRTWRLWPRYFDEELIKALRTARVRGFKGPLPS